MLKHRLKRFALGLALFGSMTVAPVHAIEQYVTVIYKQVDVCFIDKNDQELNSVLQGNVSDDNYYLIENYTMKKIRRLVVDEDYEFALQANLIVIDNNLDNLEAVELYSTISSALEKQQELERRQAEKEAAVQAKYEAELNKQRTATVKLYNTSVTGNGKEVYLADKNDKYTALNWAFRFNAANFMLVSLSDKASPSIRYGIGANFNLDYSFDKFSLGLDSEYNYIMMCFDSENDNTFLSNFYADAKFGFGKIGRYLMFRGGIAGILNMDLSGGTSVLQQNFFTPTAGLCVNHIALGSAMFSAGVDYYIASLSTSGMKFAMGGDFNFSIPVTKMEKIQVSFNVGAKDVLFVKDDRIENRASGVLAIGVENVTK